MRNPRKGDLVRIGRDENLYPGKGTWPRFRGRIGTVVAVNRDGGVYTWTGRKPTVRVYRRRPTCSLNEYGVSFTKSAPDTKFLPSVDAWFRSYELTVMGAAVPQKPR